MRTDHFLDSLLKFLFIFTVQESEDKITGVVKTVLDQELELLPKLKNKDPKSLNNEFLANNSNSLPHVYAGKVHKIVRR